MAGGQSVLLVKGRWRRFESGVWQFDAVTGGRSVGLMLSSRTSFEELKVLAKRRLLIDPDAAVELSYQWPHYMLMDDGKDAPPVEVGSQDDLDLFVEMRAEIQELNLCVSVLDEKEGFGGEEKTNAAEKWAWIEMEKQDMRKAKKIMEDNSSIGSSSDSEEDTCWHDFAQLETESMPVNPPVRKTAAEKGKRVDYGSGSEDYEEKYTSSGFEEGSCSSPRVRGTTSRAVLDGVYADEEEPPAMFGMDAPPVVDNVAEDGIDNALEDVAYEGDGVFVGRIFRSKADCKIKMAIHAINRKFHFRTARSNPTYMEFLCVNADCPWRVYASVIDCSNQFQIKKACLKHTCPIDDRRLYHRQATTQVIGELIQARFLPGRKGPGPAEIQRIMRDEFQVHITYWKAWRCREIAMEKAFGTVSGSYAMLPAYLQNLLSSNPGTLCKTEFPIDNNGVKRFKYLFISFAPSIAGLKCMRSVVLIDGTHLGGRYGGCLITASAQDGNFQIFPIAYAVVNSENDEAYEWFFRCLQIIIPDDRGVVFISDRHKSIYSGLSKVYPLAGHGVCVVHLARNIQAKFKERRLAMLMVRAAKAYTIHGFSTAFAELKSISPACAQYLVEIGFSHWARSYFVGQRYNLMTTNVAESLNRVLKECRDFPLISMLEAIRMSLIRWFVRRRAASGEDNYGITPKVRDILDDHFYLSTKMQVNRINPDEFEVIDKKSEKFDVNIAERTCSCRQWQMLLIPCAHGLAAAAVSDVPTEALVGRVYSTEMRIQAYEGIFHPVPTPEKSQGADLLPPRVRRAPGRPRKKRIFSVGEFKHRQKSRARRCSRCLVKGHNRASCKGPLPDLTE